VDQPIGLAMGTAAAGLGAAAATGLAAKEVLVDMPLGAAKAVTGYDVRRSGEEHGGGLLGKVRWPAGLGRLLVARTLHTTSCCVVCACMSCVVWGEWQVLLWPAAARPSARPVAACLICSWYRHRALVPGVDLHCCSHMCSWSQLRAVLQI
jgi:hypothetical protein